MTRAPENNFHVRRLNRGWEWAPYLKINNNRIKNDVSEHYTTSVYCNTSFLRLLRKFPLSQRKKCRIYTKDLSWNDELVLESRWPLSTGQEVFGTRMERSDSLFLASSKHHVPNVRVAWEATRKHCLRSPHLMQMIVITRQKINDLCTSESGGKGALFLLPWRIVDICRQ